jgi:hypothetical protein
LYAELELSPLRKDKKMLFTSGFVIIALSADFSGK